jgi:RHS repeat-associated protein
MTDPNGVVTTLTYDLRQRLTSRTVGTEVTTFEYWPIGLVKNITRPDGSFNTYTYDAAHRLTEVADAEGNRLVYTLDAMGNRLTETAYDSSNTPTRVRRREFNVLNRLWKEIDAANTAAVTTTFSYDQNGNMTGIAAPLGRSTTQTYDELNRMRQSTDPLLGETHYGYNALDQLVSVTDPRNLTTNYTHNALGDLLEQSSPDSGDTDFTYDEAGNVFTRTDARGASVSLGTYTYDALNRVTQIAYPDHTITYGYDSCSHGLGRLCTMGTAGNTTSYSYDTQGRVTMKAQTVVMNHGQGQQRREVHYTYTDGLLTRRRVLPKGIDVYYDHDAAGRVSTIQVKLDDLSPTETVLSDVVYDADGQVRGWTWGNGSLAVREYDDDGRPTILDTGGQSMLTYDDAGRITDVTTDGSAPSWTHDYDDLDRLTHAGRSGLNRIYAYDANGNRTQQGGSHSSAYTYSNPLTSNRLASISGSQARTYQYNAAGNITSDGLTDFTYNSAGRMVATSIGGVTYAYNGAGQRIAKYSAGDLDGSYLYDEDGHLIEKCAGFNALGNECDRWRHQQTIWLGDIPVAAVVNTVEYHDQDGDIENSYTERFNIHTDHLNTPRRLTRADSSNTLIWRWDGDPFGVGAAQSNFLDYQYSFLFDLRLPGQVFDAETGLHYNYYRDYDPATGRYVQSDPIGLAGGINTYAYAANSPTMLVDPLGLDPYAEPYPTVPPLWPYQPGSDLTRNTANAIVDFVNDVGRTIWELCTDTDKEREEDCLRQWISDTQWCDTSFTGRKNVACHRWAEGERERCRKRQPRQPFRL